MTLPERLVVGEIVLADYPIALGILRQFADAPDGFVDTREGEDSAIKSVGFVREREGDEAADTLAAVLLGESDE